MSDRHNFKFYLAVSTFPFLIFEYNVLKKSILFFIKVYQKVFSPDHGIFSRSYRGCRFYPSCSEYTYQVVGKYGVGKGIWLGAKRIVRCHPWSEGGYDPLI